MKKLLQVIGVALCLLVFTQNSQAQVKFSAGLDIGKVLEKGYGLNYGILLGGEYLLNDNMSITLQAGYEKFSLDKDYFGGNPSSSMIPVQIGFKYYFTDNEGGLYGHLQLGATKLKWKQDLGGFLGTYEDSPTGSSGALGVGYLINGNIDLGLRYNIVSVTNVNGVSNLDYVSLRAAYNF